ncbi:cellulase family glycosylhydrolase [Fulvivirga ligni]|uniref:cellulase family glycosylhydrolase n=1 Tax=Fulvivirga ligni TaxID=2904246 RepID=UPI001F489134|nr:cellulase family glycosylhydrolase [Fulvivirga ligni]UII23710.1 cellulase family glycosylhydrolase [Fulvivirga ligni]
MKNLVKYCLVLSYLLCPFLVSCGEDDGGETPPPDEVTLSIAANSFAFGAEGGTHDTDISSNAIWKIEYDNALWARPSIQTAKGNATITITADANESTDERSMTFTLTSTGADDISITLTQEAAEEEETEPEKADFIEPDNTDMRALTSLEMSAEMGIGWNLGNSLEAISANGGVFSGNETSWGNPLVTKQLIDSVKAAGFNTVRIPVSWSHMFDNEGTYKISYAWKQRVEEVVNYVLANDMYAIINIHWDGGWMDHPFYDNQEGINTRLDAMWKQIAVYFRDYDDHLLFAGTNEVHEEGNYNAPSEENVEVQNSFNQTFVNTVRATGGRNTYRHLIVQGFNTNIDHTVSGFVVPEDDTDDRMMVEVHFYDPYQFALEENGSTSLWGDDNSGSAGHAGWGDEAWVDAQFAKMKTNFVDQGYGVILGEFGAIYRANPANATLAEHVDSRNYYLNYVTAAALENDLVPVYWDNGNTGDNGFGLFNRSTGDKAHADAIEAIVSAED